MTPCGPAQHPRHRWVRASPRRQCRCKPSITPAGSCPHRLPAKSLPFQGGESGPAPDGGAKAGAGCRGGLISLYRRLSIAGSSRPPRGGVIRCNSVGKSDSLLRRGPLVRVQPPELRVGEWVAGTSRGSAERLGSPGKAYPSSLTRSWSCSSARESNALSARRPPVQTRSGPLCRLP